MNKTKANSNSHNLALLKLEKDITKLLKIVKQDLSL